MPPWKNLEPDEWSRSEDLTPFALKWLFMFLVHLSAHIDLSSDVRFSFLGFEDILEACLAISVPFNVRMDCYIWQVCPLSSVVHYKKCFVRYYFQCKSIYKDCVEGCGDHCRSLSGFSQSLSWLVRYVECSLQFMNPLFWPKACMQWWTANVELNMMRRTATSSRNCGDNYLFTFGLTINADHTNTLLNCMVNCFQNLH